MKVLFLTHRVPHPPNRGDRIRSYHILRYLSPRVDVDLACLSAEPVPQESRQELARLCRRVAIVPQGRTTRWARAAASFARGRSATQGLFESPALAQILKQWAEDTRYDAVLAYCSSMGQYFNVGSLAQTPAIVDLVDVDSQKWFDYAGYARSPVRWLYRAEARRVRQLETALVERARAVTVVSTAEARMLRQFCPRAPVHVVSNGVDIDYFGEVADAAAAGDSTACTLDRLECVFVGALDYLPNVDGITWFTREVWPQIRARFPAIRLVLVGRRPVAAVRKLARQPGIEVIRDVPDVRPYLRRATIVVVPLRIARGIQNKVLEALAAGKPVIASPQALEGLLVSPAEHVCQAATPAQWTSRILTLLTDDAERRRLAAAGQALVYRHHQWASCLEPLERWLGIATPTSAASLEAASRPVAIRV